jgi:hypothetical protein
VRRVLRVLRVSIPSSLLWVRPAVRRVCLRLDGQMTNDPQDPQDPAFAMTRAADQRIA